MSKYTTEVRFICETNADLTESVGYSSVQDVLEKSAPKIFDFDFPIFDEAYRLPLEIKILRHYYTREICEETVGLWKLRLEDKLNTIMPYYNQLYKSELIKFNPLYDVDLTRDHNTQNNGESNSENNVNTTNNGNFYSTETGKNKSSETSHNITNEDRNETSDNTSNETVDTNTHSTTTDTVNTTKSDNGWKLYSDTPQGGIRGIKNFYEENPTVDNMAYLTNATNETNTETTKTNDTTENTTTGNQTTTGKINNKTNATNNSDTTGDVNRTEDNTLNRSDTTINTGTENATARNTITNTENYLEHVKGKQSGLTFSQMLKEFRETFLNIDQMIIEELSTLFFGLW